MNIDIGTRAATLQTALEIANERWREDARIARSEGQERLALQFDKQLRESEELHAIVDAVANDRLDDFNYVGSRHHY